MRQSITLEPNKSLGIFTDHPVARCFQDSLIVPQHAFLAEGTWQSAGRALLTMPLDRGFP